MSMVLAILSKVEFLVVVGLGGGVVQTEYMVNPSFNWDQDQDENHSLVPVRCIQFFFKLVFLFVTLTDRQGNNNEFHNAFEKIYKKQGVDDSSEAIQDFLDIGDDT